MDDEVEHCGAEDDGERPEDLEAEVELEDFVFRMSYMWTVLSFSDTAKYREFRLLGCHSTDAGQKPLDERRSILAKERCELDARTSQNLTDLSSALVQRIGGSWGWKRTRSSPALCAVNAHTSLPCVCVLKEDLHKINFN